jgi:hypothetical protein
MMKGGFRAALSLQERIMSMRQNLRAVNAYTASTTQTQAGALVLDMGSAIHRVTTVGTAADAVKLPKAISGRVVIVINAAAANAMGVFPASGDAINALAADAVYSMAANKTALFVCAVDGTWNTILTA